MKPSPTRTMLRLLREVAGSEVVERMGLQEPAERLTFHATRTGYRVADRANQGLQKARQLLTPSRFRKSAGVPGQLFDLRLSDEQLQLQELLRAFGSERLRPLAGAADETRRASRELLDEIHALGIAELFLPHALGGSGEARSVLTALLVTEGLAWGDAGIATAALAPLGATNALLLWGNADQQQQWVGDGVVSGLPAGVLAVNEPRPMFEPLAMQTVARSRGRHYRLSGEKCLVPVASDAEWFLVVAGLGQGHHGLLLVPRDARGVSVEADPAMGLAAADFGLLRLDDVELGQDALLASNDFDYQRFLQLTTLSACALCIGTAQAVLDYVIPYCNDREAFGEPVSQRQGVAFTIADIATELDAMRLLAQRAAAQLDQGLDAARATRLAAISCSQWGPWIASAGVQLLGGHGYVREHPLERWYRNLCAASTMHGVLML